MKVYQIQIYCLFLASYVHEQVHVNDVGSNNWRKSFEEKLKVSVQKLEFTSVHTLPLFSMIPKLKIFQLMFK